MANIVYVKIKEERELKLQGNKFVPINEAKAQKTAYICCDSLACWVGTFNTIEDLMELVGPENIIETIKENLSEIESQKLLSLLQYNNYKYKLDYFDNNFLIAKEN